MPTDSKTAGHTATPCAKWTPDCQGKWDYDGRLISVSCRYWPRGGGFHILTDGELRPSIERHPEVRPSAVASIVLNHGEPDDNGYGDYTTLREAKFEADTEEEVKAAVEQWVADQFRHVLTAVNSHASNLRKVGALRDALRKLTMDANRLCDRQLGGTYEEDCRRSIEEARRALALAEEQANETAG